MHLEVSLFRVQSVWIVAKNSTTIHTEHFRGNEAFVRRIYDLIDLMERRQRTIITPFFTPSEGTIAEAIMGKQIRYQKDGGHDDAQRCRYALVPYEGDAVDLKITSLKATFPAQFSKLTHRDVLGALMNQGIERETIGDIFIQDGCIYLYADRDIEQYVVCNLTKIKRCNIHFTSMQNRIQHQQNIVETTEIVSSLRLDAMVSALIHVSRGKAQDFIRGGLVKVNHVVLEQSAALCNNNSAISIRGYGRFQFFEVIKMTKKDHYVIRIGRYL